MTARVAETGGSASNSLLLAAVKFFTLAAGLVSTMVLAHRFDLDTYGTYAQTNLVVTIASTVTVLGLADAANYFFNRASDRDSAQNSVNTIFTLQLMLGVGCGIGILACGSILVDYFDNSALASLWLWIAFRPMLANIGLTLQVLTISVGRARAIALRNGGFSLSKLLSVLLISAFTSNLHILLGVMLALDLLSALWFWTTLRAASLILRPGVLRLSEVKPIVAFSLPMGVYVATSVLGREVDKMVIAAHYAPEDYAIYANAATVLPLDIVSSSFLIVLIPILTRYMAAESFGRARRAFRHYLTIGYLTTVTFALAAISVAPELIELFYGEKYLPGEEVFRLYLISAGVRFAATSLVLSASGRASDLMKISVASLAVGALASVSAHWAFGFSGPAYAAVLVGALTSAVTLALSVRRVKGAMRSIIRWRPLLWFMSTSAVALCGAFLLLSSPAMQSAGAFVRAVTIVPTYIALVLGLNWRTLSNAFRALNAAR